MPHIILISENNRQETECAFGAKLSDVLRLHGADVDFPCAGRGRCLQCRVMITGKTDCAGEVSSAERAALGGGELARGVRLACLARVFGDMSVEVFPKPKAEQIAGCGFLPEFSLKPSYRGFAAAVDIGTTTLAASLCAPDSAAPLKTAVMKNPQTVYGADVISRIELSLAGKSEELAACITGAVNALLADLRKDGDFSRITIAGNTAMLYLLTRQNPVCLSRAPFTLDRPFDETIDAENLGLYAPPETPVYLPRCISSFVGADITAAITASRLCAQKKPSILVDIGTNGEMALFVPPHCRKDGQDFHNKAVPAGGNGCLYVCSTAAGPAFEGGGITMGLRGVSGAIDSIVLAGGSLVCHTIGSVPSRGICGSGIIDAAAVLIQTGIIDETGAIQEYGHDFERHVTEYGGETAVLLDANVVITQKDIRNIQLAKSAVSAGMQTLLSEAGLTADDIEHVFLAGGFGSYVNLQNASHMGLIPPQLCAKARVLGNASLSGAVLMTQNADYVEESSRYAAYARTVDLASNKTFMDLYVQNMFF